jgi:hypothetical protein
LSILTTRLKWPVPSEHQEPWYKGFQNLVNAQDATSYASKEDRNLVVSSESKPTFNSVSGLLTWSSSIKLLSAPTGFYWEIEAGSETLLEGQFLYVTLPRSPTDNITVSTGVAYQLPEARGDDHVVLVVRFGDYLFWRSGTEIGIPSKLRIDTFTATAGQTVFTLSYAPDDDIADMAIGGIVQQYGEDYTVSGVTVTYSGSLIEENQKVRIIYMA